MSTTTWNIDPSHSEVSFKVRHLMISNVRGNFTKFSATATTEDDNFETAKITFEAEAASVTTHSEQRDAHIKSPDFFDTEKYPSVKFESTKMEKTGDKKYTLHGNLTINATTKPVHFNVELQGLGKDPWGQTKAGFEISGKINRTDFGLVWNAALESGGVLVSEEVSLHAEAQFVKAAPVTA